MQEPGSHKTHTVVPTVQNVRSARLQKHQNQGKNPSRICTCKVHTRLHSNRYVGKAQFCDCRGRGNGCSSYFTLLTAPLPYVPLQCVAFHTTVNGPLFPTTECSLPSQNEIHGPIKCIIISILIVPQNRSFFNNFGLGKLISSL